MTLWEAAGRRPGGRAGGAFRGSAVGERSIGGVRPVRAALAYLAIFGLYSDVYIDLGAQIIPNVLGMAAAICLIALHAGRLVRSEVSALLLVWGVSLIGIIATPDFSQLFVPRVSGSIQFLYSLIVGFGLVLELRTWSAATFRITFKCIFWIIIVGSIIEILTPLKSVVQWYSNVYSTPITESKTMRDIAIAGFYRPKFFTSEVSHVSKAVVVFITAIYITRPTLAEGVRLAIWLTIAAIIIRSPIVFLGFPLLWIVYTFVRMPGSGGSAIAIRGIVSTLLLVAGGFAVAAGGYLLLSDRLEAIATGQDFSTTIRLSAGVVIGFRTAFEFPLFGVGFGGLGAAQDIMQTTFIQLGVPAAIALLEWEQLVNNAIGSHFLYLGFGGLFIHLAAVYLLLN
ncbi:MAG: hypothetical protein MI723_03615, partial [Caulobacterales bacterium]|nr:hypothetical protein [Caulobacterales bacterium]